MALHEQGHSGRFQEFSRGGRSDLVRAIREEIVQDGCFVVEA